MCYAQREAEELEHLQHRTWLLHWSLSVFFGLENGPRGMLIDFFFQPAYVAA